MNQEISNAILIVDDDPYILESLSLLLNEHGYSVISCEDARSAITKLLEHRIDVVLADIKMPGVSGIKLLEEIHSINPEIPVILMTAYAELDIAVDAIKKGAFDFIIKPYKPEYIIYSIEKGIRHNRLIQIEKAYNYMLKETAVKRTEELAEALIMIKDMSRELIQRLTAVAEFRDTGARTHILRIGLYSSKIAEALYMPADFIETIKFSGPMHDIGKIGIPDSILLKPGPLTPEEFEIIKTHAIIGEKILSGSSHKGIQMAASITLHHHERWDGTGYPKGLRGEEIPIEGRIVLICDHYDALRSKRPYKPPLGHKEALRIIIEGDEKTMPGHFDPRVLDAFIKVSSIFEDIFDTCQD